MPRIDLTKSWRRRNGILQPGIYRVPVDMSEADAQQAVSLGLGAMTPDPKPKKPVKMLRGAPENKALTVTPEDKEPTPFPGTAD
jgi:hypothetical protein